MLNQGTPLLAVTCRIPTYCMGLMDPCVSPWVAVELSRAELQAAIQRAHGIWAFAHWVPKPQLPGDNVQCVLFHEVSFHGKKHPHTLFSLIEFSLLCWIYILLIILSMYCH